MVGTDVFKIDEVVLATTSEAETLAAVAHILLDSIPPDKKRQNACKVMAYLAEMTCAAARGGTVFCRFSTKEIYTDLNGNPNREPSGWLSPLWKEVEGQWYPAIKEVLVMRCKEAGFDVYPVIMKGEGTPSYYWIETRKIIEKNSDVDLDKLNDPPFKPAVIYQKDLTLQLSFAGRIFFRNGMKWTSAKRYSFLTWNLLYLIFNLIYVIATILVLWNSKGAMRGQELVILIFGVLVPYLAYRHGSSIWRLFEDRIIIAPDWTIAWKEFGATIEISRSNDRELPSTIQVNRYSALCPICGWMVKLEKGEPDFQRRIVGRCEENPREHVFSFDRSTRQGIPLRHTPVP
jgi:hypothetical protein